VRRVEGLSKAMRIEVELLVTTVKLGSVNYCEGIIEDFGLVCASALLVRRRISCSFRSGFRFRGFFSSVIFWCLPVSLCVCRRRCTYTLCEAVWL